MTEEIQQVFQLDEFENLVKSNRLMIAYFFGSSYEESLFIGPKFSELSKKYEKVKFVRVDIDKDDDEIAANYGVEYLPTFIIFKDGEELVNLFEVDEKELAKRLDKLTV